MLGWQHLPRQPSTIGPDPLLIADVVTAFMLLTRLPIARFARFGAPPDLARCVWAFPLVGVAVNGMGGLVYWLAHRVGMPPLLAAAWTLAATMIVTGAFHEDGLADTADGFGGGSTRVRKMEIMRDSRIGSYGALALLLSVVVRMAAMAALGRPGIVAIAMILAGMLGRSGMLLLLLLLPPARDDGMGASMGKPRTEAIALGLGLAMVAAFLSLPGLPAIVAVALGFSSSLVVARLAHMQIGGHTGDLLGASEVITECVVLTVMVSAFSA
jgi:adenosylcobinamide-GDP ribazoletransferase